MKGGLTVKNPKKRPLALSLSKEKGDHSNNLGLPILKIKASTPRILKTAKNIDGLQVEIAIQTSLHLQSYTLSSPKY